MTSQSYLLRLGAAIILCSLIFSISLLIGESSSLADPSIERQRALLEKGLTLHEIDREIERIEQREKELEQQIVETELQIQVQEQSMEREKERAGKVFRAYYIGERDAFLTALFKLDGLSDFFTFAEYIQIIFASDREIIKRYSDSTEALKQTVASLKQTEVELAEVKQLYLERRQLALDTQAELDAALAAMAEASEIEAQIKQLTEQWENEGLPLFRRYFQSLAKAMNDLPEILDEGDHLTMKGLTWNFHLKDADLNKFLRTKNELFENITFRFEDDFIIAEGTSDDMSLLISGQFSIVEEPEHHIGFSIITLEFEGFALPRSTALEMEERFDLGFYPKSIVPFVRATELHIQNNALNIKLEIDLSSE